MSGPSDWLTAGEALSLLLRETSWISPTINLRDRLANGLLRSRAQLLIDDGGKHPLVELPSSFWAGVSGTQGWQAGDFESNLGGTIQKAIGVQFDRVEVLSLIPQDRQPTADMAMADESREARFWRDLWPDLCGAIYAGEVIPEQQKNVEEWMLQWATNGGHPLSEAGARTRAQAVIKAIKRRG